MKNEKELFEDINHFHDVFCELGFNFTDKQLKKLFRKLPENIRNIAHCWGMSDTVFRDESFIYFRDNPKELDEFKC